MRASLILLFLPLLVACRKDDTATVTFEVKCRKCYVAYNANRNDGGKFWMGDGTALVTWTKDVEGGSRPMYRLDAISDTTTFDNVLVGGVLENDVLLDTVYMRLSVDGVPVGATTVNKAGQHGVLTY